jgi:hypothetical protein
VRGQSVQPSRQQNGRSAEIKKRAEDGHSDGAKRDESGFYFPTGEISGRDAAQANPDCDRSLQICGVRVVNMQDVVAVN